MVPELDAEGDEAFRAQIAPQSHRITLCTAQVIA